LPDAVDRDTVRIHSIGRRELNRLLSDAKSATDGRKGHLKPGHKVRRLTHRPNRVFELTRTVVRWAVEQEILTANPMLGMKRPIRKEAPRERTLSPAEIQTLWSALDKVPTKQATWKRQDGALPMSRATALTMKLSLTTAQRIGEVSGIALSELDLNDTTPMWIIPSSRAKNREPHRVPLSPLALQLIGEARDLGGSSPWLFPSPNGEGGIDPHASTKALGRARAAIGLDDFRVHDLRRTAATHMAEMGINPHTISLVLNHISIRRGTITGKVYNQYSYDREKREALNTWGARLERLSKAVIRR
jgi:integrase